MDRPLCLLPITIRVDGEFFRRPFTFNGGSYSSYATGRAGEKTQSLVGGFSAFKAMWAMPSAAASNIVRFQGS